MATVTKVIRWGDTNNSMNIGTRNQDSGSRDSFGGITGGGILLKDSQTLVGLRMIVNPGLIRDRDAGSGCKLFALIPPNITTVRAFKNHLSTKILKSHVPFFFFNGDYRIPDEEDIRIFSLLSEPCKVLPVPTPRSVLSLSSLSAVTTSTPLPNGVHGLCQENSTRTTDGTPPSSKRVKFNDNPRETNNNWSMEVSGCSSFERVNEDNVDAAAAAAPTENNQLAIVDGSTESPDANLVSRRRKRHRKHKVKKSRILQEADDNDEGVNMFGDDGSEETTTSSTLSSFVSEDNKSSNNPKENGFMQGQGPILVNKRKSSITRNQEYDADESEIDLSQTGQQQQRQVTTSSLVVNMSTETVTPVNGEGKKKKSSLDKSEFLSPNTAFSETGYKRIRTSTSGGTSGSSGGGGNKKKNQHTLKSQQQNGVVIEEICDGTEESSGKRRDTPMLPRILKNPCAATTFEQVKKSLSFEKEVGSGTESCDDNNEANGNVVNSTSTTTTQQVEDKDDDCLSKYVLQLGKIQDFKEIKVGDRIMFKALEMNEHYSPELSELKVAEVKNVNLEGTLLLSYITFGKPKEIKQRSGIFDIEDEDLRTEQDNPHEKKFNELFEPIFVLIKDQ